LVVDDEAAIRQAYGDLLRKKGYEVETIESGERALEVIQETGYDLILLDIRLKGISGIETLQRLRKMKNDIKVIIMSGYISKSYVEESFRLGAVNCLHKPFSIETLAQNIHKALC